MLSPCGRFSQGKKTLLPLRSAEKKTVIFPWDPTLQATEMRNVVSMARRGGPWILLEAGSAGGRAKASEGTPCQGQRRWPALTLLLPGQMRELMETLPVLLLLLLLCGLDWALYSIFDTIRHHSFVQYSFRSEPGPHSRLQAQETPPWRTPILVQSPLPNSSNFVTSFCISPPPSLSSLGSNISPAT